MKVIFLDVDGVLNTSNSRKILSISKSKLKLLQELVIKTDAKIVVSSSWRLSTEALDRLKKVLAYRNMFVFSTTTKDYPINVTKIRGWQIQQWLNDYPEVANYVILDDDNDMLITQQLNFIRTNMANGLTKEHINKAMEILNA